MERLLCIVSSMDRGGAETFLMKIYRSLDKTKYQMDFCVSKPTPGFYDEEIKANGGKIYVTALKSKKPLKSFLDVVKVVKKGKYKAVLRTSQQSLATIDLLAAKLGGADILVYRSSSADIKGGIHKRIINRLFSFLPRIIPNVKIAPSTEAAEFVFGKRAVKKGKCKIIPNGLDYDKFKFDLNLRNKIRKELKLENNLIFGHVGRFSVEKNHEFLINTFYEIHKKNSNAVLVLIGEGILEDNIKEIVSKLGLNSCVRFLGPKASVCEYMMAMDLLIFPSYFEGMPNVVIEAQAASLRCLVSDTITKECKITNLVDFKSLNESAQQWALFALNSLDYERKSYKNQFSKAGYCIEDVTEKFIHNIFNS